MIGKKERKYDEVDVYVLRPEEKKEVIRVLRGQNLVKKNHKKDGRREVYRHFKSVKETQKQVNYLIISPKGTSGLYFIVDGWKVMRRRESGMKLKEVSVIMVTFIGYK